MRRRTCARRDLSSPLSLPSQTGWTTCRVSTDKRSHLFTTLNLLSPPDSAHILGLYAYSHPVFSNDAVHAQHALAQLNARVMESGWHRAFAGAWACYGFHKDSFALPFAITDVDVEQASWARQQGGARV